MPSPTTVQKGLGYVLRHSDNTTTPSYTTIGGGTNANLTINQELIETTNKGTSGWKKSLNGMRSWGMDFDGMYLEGTAEQAGETLYVTVGSNPVKGIKNVSWTVSTDLIDSVNQTVGLDRNVCAATQTLSVTISGEWYDVDLNTTTSDTGDEGLELVIDELLGSTTSGLATYVEWGGGTQGTRNNKFTATMRPLDFSLSTPHDGIMEYSITLEGIADMSSILTEAAGSGQSALLADVFGGTVFEVILYNQQDYTEWTGEAFAESFTVDMEFTGVITCTASMVGHGALTMQASAA